MAKREGWEKRMFRVKLTGERAYTANGDEVTADLDFDSMEEIERLKKLDVGQSMRLVGYASIKRVG
jgi:hypothetical protein